MADSRAHNLRVGDTVRDSQTNREGRVLDVLLPVGAAVAVVTVLFFGVKGTNNKERIQVPLAGTGRLEKIGEAASSFVNKFNSPSAEQDILESRATKNLKTRLTTTPSLFTTKGVTSIAEEELLQSSVNWKPQYSAYDLLGNFTPYEITQAHRSIGQEGKGITQSNSTVFGINTPGSKAFGINKEIQKIQEIFDNVDSLPDEINKTLRDDAARIFKEVKIKNKKLEQTAQRASRKLGNGKLLAEYETDKILKIRAKVANFIANTRNLDSPGKKAAVLKQLSTQLIELQRDLDSALKEEEQILRGLVHDVFTHVKNQQNPPEFVKSDLGKFTPFPDWKDPLHTRTVGVVPRVDYATSSLTAPYKTKRFDSPLKKVSVNISHRNIESLLLGAKDKRSFLQERLIGLKDEKSNIDSLLKYLYSRGTQVETGYAGGFVTDAIFNEQSTYQTRQLFALANESIISKDVVSRKFSINADKDWSGTQYIQEAARRMQKAKLQNISGKALTEEFAILHAPVLESAFKQTKRYTSLEKNIRTISDRLDANLEHLQFLQTHPAAENLNISSSVEEMGRRSWGRAEYDSSFRYQMDPKLNNLGYVQSGFEEILDRGDAEFFGGLPDLHDVQDTLFRKGKHRTSRGITSKLRIPRHRVGETLGIFEGRNPIGTIIVNRAGVQYRLDSFIGGQVVNSLEEDYRLLGQGEKFKRSFVRQNDLPLDVNRRQILARPVGSTAYRLSEIVESEVNVKNITQNVKDILFASTEPGGFVGPLPNKNPAVAPPTNFFGTPLFLGPEEEVGRIVEDPRFISKLKQAIPWNNLNVKQGTDTAEDVLQSAHAGAFSFGRHIYGSVKTREELEKRIIGHIKEKGHLLRRQLPEDASLFSDLIEDRLEEHTYAQVEEMIGARRSVFDAAAGDLELVEDIGQNKSLKKAQSLVLKRVGHILASEDREELVGRIGALTNVLAQTRKMHGSTLSKMPTEVASAYAGARKELKKLKTKKEILDLGKNLFEKNNITQAVQKLNALELEDAKLSRLLTTLTTAESAALSIKTNAPFEIAELLAPDREKAQVDFFNFILGKAKEAEDVRRTPALQEHLNRLVRLKGSGYGLVVPTKIGTLLYQSAGEGGGFASLLTNPQEVFLFGSLANDARTGTLLFPSEANQYRVARGASTKIDKTVLDAYRANLSDDPYLLTNGQRAFGFTNNGAVRGTARMGALAEAHNLQRYIGFDIETEYEGERQNKIIKSIGVNQYEKVGDEFVLTKTQTVATPQSQISQLRKFKGRTPEELSHYYEVAQDSPEFKELRFLQEQFKNRKITKANLKEKLKGLGMLEKTIDDPLTTTFVRNETELLRKAAGLFNADDAVMAFNAPFDINTLINRAASKGVDTRAYESLVGREIDPLNLAGVLFKGQKSFSIESLMRLIRNNPHYIEPHIAGQDPNAATEIFNYMLKNFKSEIENVSALEAIKPGTAFKDKNGDVFRFLGTLDSEKMAQFYRETAGDIDPDKTFGALFQKVNYLKTSEGLALEAHQTRTAQGLGELISGKYTRVEESDIPRLVEERVKDLARGRVRKTTLDFKLLLEHQQQYLASTTASPGELLHGLSMGAIEGNPLDELLLKSAHYGVGNANDRIKAQILEESNWWSEVGQHHTQVIDRLKTHVREMSSLFGEEAAFADANKAWSNYMRDVTQVADWQRFSKDVVSTEQQLSLYLPELGGNPKAIRVASREAIEEDISDVMARVLRRMHSSNPDKVMSIAQNVSKTEAKELSSLLRRSNNEGLQLFLRETNTGRKLHDFLWGRVVQPAMAGSSAGNFLQEGKGGLYKIAAQSYSSAVDEILTEGAQYAQTHAEAIPENLAPRNIDPEKLKAIQQRYTTESMETLVGKTKAPLTIKADWGELGYLSPGENLEDVAKNILEGANEENHAWLERSFKEIFGLAEDKAEKKEILSLYNKLFNRKDNERMFRPSMAVRVEQSEALLSSLTSDSTKRSFNAGKAINTAEDIAERLIANKEGAKVLGFTALGAAVIGGLLVANSKMRRAEAQRAPRETEETYSTQEDVNKVKEKIIHEKEQGFTTRVMISGSSEPELNHEDLMESIHAVMGGMYGKQLSQQTDIKDSRKKVDSTFLDNLALKLLKENGAR